MAGNYQVSNKLPDGRIFVIGGETFAEYKTNLVEVLGTDGADNVINQMASALEGAPISLQQAVSNLSSLNATPVQVQESQTFTPSTAPTSKTCKHGEMTKRTGAGAKGPWKAFMCPSPKGTPDQCEPSWVRRNDPEWSSF
jgi:hypothetical protein